MIHIFVFDVDTYFVPIILFYFILIENLYIFFKINKSLLSFKIIVS